jgi:hypothetical protein
MNLTGMIRMRIDRLQRYGIKPAAIVVANSDMEGLAQEFKELAYGGILPSDLLPEAKVTEMFGLKVHPGPVTGIVIGVDQ